MRERADRRISVRATFPHVFISEQELDLNRIALASLTAALFAALTLSPAAVRAESTGTPPPPANAPAAVDVDRYVRADLFESIKISPKGDYLAATVPLDNGQRTGLVIMSRADKQITGAFSQGKNTHISDFHWVNDERVLIGIAEKLGALEAPQSTGELVAVNADGGKPQFLIGQRMMGEGAGTRIQPRKVERVAAYLVDPLLSDDKRVIISVMPFSADPYTRAESMDVYTGRRVQVAKAPVRNASFITDNHGVVRFAAGAGTDRRQRVYYRDGNGSDWQLINDESASNLVWYPLGFAADDSVAYIGSTTLDGPDEVLAFDPATGKTKRALRDNDVDPAMVLQSVGGAAPVGVLLHDGKPRTAFFDEQSEDARLYRSLEAAFAGDAVRITSQTADGNLTLVKTWSDRSPGDYYLFNRETKKADHLLSQREWFDPREMAERRPITLKARDGLTLHGYLTLPKGVAAKSLPMVVHPHGGPFEIQDTWGFENDPQLLAEAGYAVLQLNFRGSGGYGKPFINAGQRQWGLAMQDDLTDATRWAIKQGFADAGRICIYGGSYGAYASLMGVAKEPDLYRCAVGYAGVYDLPTMHTHGDIQGHGSGETYLREWIGERSELAAVSPSNMADRIKVPVFLAAGGEDQRTPIEHSKMMERALRSNGVPVETLYYKNEGHGFYLEANRREYYTRLLDFLSRHIGGAPAKTG
ncbi:S9 family peptidase [Lysobacter sp. H21R4]|nr:S9 family peptidase [Lysobacter sp. H21R4]